MIVVKAGSSIGVGIIANGQLHRGARGLAGDVSHTAVADGPKTLCSCGRFGCLDAVAGGRAIVAALAKPDSPAAAGQPDSSALSAQPDPSAAAATPDSAAVLAEPGPSPGQGEPPAGSAAEPESAEPAGDRAGLG